MVKGGWFGRNLHGTSGSRRMSTSGLSLGGFLYTFLPPLLYVLRDCLGCNGDLEGIGICGAWFMHCGKYFGCDEKRSGFKGELR